MLENQLEMPTREEFEKKLEKLKSAVDEYKEVENIEMKKLKLNWSIQLVFPQGSPGFFTRLAVWYILKKKGAKFERDFKLKD